MGTLDLSIPERHRPFLRVGTCSWKCDAWKDLIYREDANHSPFD